MTTKTLTTRISTILTVLCMFAGLFALPALADKPDSMDGVSDAWIDGKLEATYFFNRHLSSFDIETDVEHGTVILSGWVTSDVERQLAEEIAREVKGVKSVRNELKVVRDRKPEKNENAFVRFVEDRTITAAVKLRLIQADEVPALSIDVDTENGVVTLDGEVESGATKSLVAKLARNVDGVVRVENRLDVRGS